MSERLKDGTVIIKAERPDFCELCGEKAELRPYGPHGEYVCFPCGMKNEKAAKKMFERTLLGKTDDGKEPPR